MKYFAKTMTQPFIRENNYRKILEIGASKGENSERLLELDGIELTIIDPCFDCDLKQKFASCSNVRVLKGLSLQVLPTLKETFDCIFIDGDHNWYTVFNEIKTIEERGLLAPNGSMLFHDVGWPYARRDMYYDPENIPREFMHAAAKEGIVRNRSQLSKTEGIGNTVHNATFEGGKRNGVLTAIEDYLKVSKNKYEFVTSNQQHGLGILMHIGDKEAVPIFRKWRAKIKRFDMMAALPYGLGGKIYQWIK